ncbi:hypothetical protein AAC387_Pa05g3727 [Persea americana]
MDRILDREKSSRKHRDERDRERDYHRDLDLHHDRDRDHKHRSSRDTEDRHHRDTEDRHHRDDKRSSKDEDGSRDRVSKHREGDRHRQKEDLKRERSHEPRNGREGSRDRDRARDSVDRDHKSHREESVERRSAHKRKDHGDERSDRSEKRIRASDGAKEERREKRRFEDRVLEDSREMNGVKKEERREERRLKEGEEFEEDIRKKEEARSAEEVKLEKKPAADKHLDDSQVLASPDRSGSIANGAALQSLDVASRVLPETSSICNPVPTKVSSISTTNENKGVSVTRSHEVPGKSSTDGTTPSAAGKSGSLSLDALAKAKRALQMQKEMSEKLKKFPQLNKSVSSSSDSSKQVGSVEGSKVPSSGAGGPAPAASSAPVQAVASASTAVKTPTGSMTALAGINIEAVKRAQELAAKMGFHQDPDFGPVINMFPGQMPLDVSGQQKPAKAPVLRLDAQGREIDEHGNVINMPKLTNLSTLKVNINKQKKEAFQILRPELDADTESNPHFDVSMGVNKTKLMRPKRMTFQFVDEGKWSKQADIIRFKNQFGEAQAKELKAKQAQLAKAKAELDINPNLIEVSERVVIKDKQKDPIPEIEWWDAPLLLSGTYNGLVEDNVADNKLKMDKITMYVEHPQPIEPPAEPAPPPPQPLKLTKKEQKKLRTQRRLAKEKDRQEMIRQGLIEPPKPKIKMSNLMKVLGSEATQDPTRLEMEIRSAAAEREQAHVDRNIARKLTPAERREKKERKLFDDPSTLETFVSVYKINDLSHPQTRFKVDVNAQENRLTGCAVISDGVSVVVVEGGSKSIKRYGKLMLKRINWAAAVANEEEDDEKDVAPINKCMLVWQGSAAKPSFNRFLIHQCRTEAAARKVFADAGVAHYWELAVNFSDDQI